MITFLLEENSHGVFFLREQDFVLRKCLRYFTKVILYSSLSQSLGSGFLNIHYEKIVRFLVVKLTKRQDPQHIITFKIVSTASSYLFYNHF